MKSQKKIVERVIESAKGPAKLARAIREKTEKPLTTQAVCQWTRIPIEWVKAVEEITGIPRYELRPDVYDRPIVTVLKEVRA